MENKIKNLTGLLFINLIAFSCMNVNQESKIEGNPKDSTVYAAKMDSSQIVKATVTDEKGQKLEMIFNNNDNTAKMILGKESFELKGEPMASGISYKNEHYSYSEHQGDIELLKDGKVIFKKSEKK